MSKAPRRDYQALSSHDQDMPGTAQELKATGMSPPETARYIAEFTAELSYLARQSRLDLLAYLLDMARLEAGRALQSSSKDK